jgi:hypothetical protein
VAVRTLHGDSVRMALFDDVNLTLERWYHVTVTHTNSERTPWSKSEVRLHIDGRAAGRATLRYTTFAALPLAAIGGNVALRGAPPQLGLTTTRAIDGQLGTIYVFDETLSSDEVARLHALGANYAGTFRDAAVLERATARLFLAYHCSATTDVPPAGWRLPPDRSPRRDADLLDADCLCDSDERDTNRRPLWCIDLAAGEKVCSSITFVLDCLMSRSIGSR